jgi:hypothetical protein
VALRAVVCESQACDQDEEVDRVGVTLVVKEAISSRLRSSLPELRELRSYPVTQVRWLVR